MIDLLPAALLFVATHLGISSTRVRPLLVGVLGERGYLAFYSLVSVLTLGYLIWLYNNLPRYEYLWLPSPELHGAARLVMPLSLFLVAGAFMVRNPTAVGGSALLREPHAAALARGVTRITRHPFQWGVLIWAGVHMAANGDAQSVVFFATFAVVAGLGTVLLDRKAAAAGGDGWRDYAAVTSNVPFAAVLGGRNRLVLRELWLPAVVAMALYAAFTLGHPWVSGVRIV
ncbi:MAG: NnrU family protein [Pseudomonadales bacterium]